MHNISHLVKPRFFSLKNSIRKEKWKLPLIFFGGVCFWLAVFFISIKLLSYFKRAELIGDLLLYRFLSMVLLIFFGSLILSNIISALSTFLLARDLEICFSRPCSIEEIFISRMILSTFDSSWMLIIFGSPVIIAYAWIYHVSIRFFIDLAQTWICLVIISADIGILLTLFIANIIPAYRVKEVLFILGIVLFSMAYVLFRFLRPERLVNPDTFFAISQYLKSLKAPDSPYLPSQWMCAVLWKDLKGSLPSKLHISLLWSTALSLFFINVWLSKFFYFRAYSKALESRKEAKVSYKLIEAIRKIFTYIYGRQIGAIMDKELRIFLRDSTQWTQVILLTALAIVYVYNFKVLPLSKAGLNLYFLQNEIAFLNIGFTGFFISALCVRFVFPSISIEGESFWIIKSSPLSIKKFIWSKFLFYSPFMLLLAEALVICTNYMLFADTFIMILSICDTFFISTSIVGIAIGMGAIYPNFRHENIAQVATSIGAVIYMIVSFTLLAIVMLIQAIPVYCMLISKIKFNSFPSWQLTLICIAFIISVVILIMSFNKSLQLGIHKLEEISA